MDQLALDVSTPENPAKQLYQYWWMACEWDGYRGSVGDRVYVKRGFTMPSAHNPGWQPSDGLTLVDRDYNTMLTLWEDGTFKFHASPCSRYDFWSKQTFLVHNYAVRTHVWTVRNLHRLEPAQRHHRYDWLNERDFETRTPYIDPGFLVRNFRYRLALDKNFWVIRAVGDEDDSDDRMKLAIDCIRRGYEVAQERYDRFERKASRPPKPPKAELSLRTEHGLLVEQAALDEMVKHLQIHAPMPKEGNK